MKSPCEIELTPNMIEAALKVDWVESHMFEFFSEDEESDRMREHIKTLWNALMAAR